MPLSAFHATDQQASEQHRRLCLFGPLRTRTGAFECVIAGSDAQRVLVYLGLHPAITHRREALAEKLFPSAPTRRRLTDALYRIRSQLGPGWVDARPETVTLGASVRVDVVEFDALIAIGDTEALAAAAEIYVDELAPSIYEDWIAPHRAARRGDLIVALTAVAADREEAGDLAAAVVAARRAVVVEPFDEDGQQRYLRLLGRLHRYGEAIAHYEALRKLLAEELDVEPMAATTETVEQLARERDVATSVIGESSSRFVGRTAERAAAIGAVEAMLEGRGRAWCVEGVAGIGKSRLIAELVGSARWRGATVFGAVVRPTPGSSALDPLARALEPAMATALRLELEASLGPVALGALSPLYPGWSRESGPSTGTQHLAYVSRVLGETLARLGDVVLVLDDLHWADATLWESLSALVEGFVSGGGLFVGAYRRPDVEQTAGWEVLQSWDRHGISTFTRLGPLDPGDVSELVGDDAASDRVMALTGGVPFYVEQWLRAPDGDVGNDVDLAKSRFFALPDADRCSLECAAVIGQDVTFGAWVRVDETTPIQLAERAERLTGGGWIVPTADGYEFAHELLRVAVYDQLSAEQRRPIHRRVADVLAAGEPDNQRTLAYHLDRAGLFDDAVDAYRATASTHRQQYAFAVAIDSWSRALELMGSDRRDERLAVMLELAEVYDIVSEQSRGRAVLAEAIELARDLESHDELARALVLHAGVALRAGEPDDAERKLEEADALIDEVDFPLTSAQLYFRRGDLRCHGGRWREAEIDFRAGMAAADRAADPWIACRLRRGVALCTVRTGRPEEGVEHLEKTLDVLRSVGDEINEMVTLTGLLVAYYDLGWWDRLEATCDLADPLARRFGDPVHIGLVCQARALGALAVGDRTTAHDQIEECHRWFELAERPWLTSGTTNIAGLIADDDGDIEDAIASYTQVIDRCGELDATTEEAYARHDLGALLWRVGRPSEAVEHLRMSADHWEITGHPLLHAKSSACLGLALWDSGDRSSVTTRLADAGIELLRSGVAVGEHPQGWLWFLAQLLRRLERATESTAAIEAAHAELVRQGKHITDDGRRRSFFEDVPLNRAIVAEYSGDASGVGGAVDRGTATIARATAPLGRTLRPDELVEVNWTLRSPDDESIDDPADRRRYRLRRLLREASEQDAAPTDDDLAAALGVSRRTIVRDVAALGASIGPRPTRRR